MGLAGSGREAPAITAEQQSQLPGGGEALEIKATAAGRLLSFGYICCSQSWELSFGVGVRKRE